MPNAEVSVINPNLLVHFLVYRLSPRKRRGHQRGLPPGFEPGTSRAQTHSSAMARHSAEAARAAISSPSETAFYDIFGLSAFSRVPLVPFCSLQER